ncbi:MAG: DUF3990 domain-containing protein [Lachnospiraceae bacterium]|nr:DUF3990 domain-containing protein [Lachnospiraceae bacterium]
MKLYHGSDRIITMPKWDRKSGSGDFGDGFYATESDELGREWAASSACGGFLNIYELDTEGLKVIDLSGDSFDINDWIAFVCLNRPDCIPPSLKRAKDKIHSSALPILADADLIKGYRADDSNLIFLKDHLAGNITKAALTDHLRYSGTGEQVCLRSKKAADRLEFKEAVTVNGSTYYPQRMMRDLRSTASFISDKHGASPSLKDASSRYLKEAMRCLGEFTGYVSAVSPYSSPDNALDIFSVSRYARLFEEDDPKVICGLSGMELHHKVMEEAGLGRDDWEDKGYDRLETGPAYKAGCMLAYFQHESHMSFSEILSAVSFAGIQAQCGDPEDPEDSEDHGDPGDGSTEETAVMISRRDAARISARIAARIAARKPSSSDLQTRRKRLALSQKELSDLSGVNLRTLQQYEIKDKDINRAAAATVYDLSRALYCNVTNILDFI